MVVKDLEKGLQSKGTQGKGLTQELRDALVTKKSTLTSDEILSPQKVREILNTDNREIVKLCKKALIIPRKDKRGQTYFSIDEVNALAAIKNESKQELTQTNSQVVVNNLLTSLEAMEKNMTNSLSKLIDEKLDGMDEVVVELIRCKTENETLRQKLNELNKENYNLKNKLKSYKPVGLGLYVKKSQDEFNI